MTDWPVKSLGEVCDFVRGVTYDKADAQSAMKNGFIPLLRATNITEKGLLLEDFVFVPSDVVRADQKLISGDALITIASGSASVVGRSVLVEDPGEMTFGAFCGVLRPGPKILPRYLSHFMSSRSVRTAWSEAAQGTNINNLKRDDILQTECQLPPLDEQKRIVALLDAATAHVTELTVSYEQARTHANDLLESSLLELFADAFESQPKRKMGEVLQIARGGSPRPISEFITKSPNGVNWIKIGDASSSTKYIYETAQKIKPEGVSRSRMVYPGDFLLSNSMSFGRPYIMKTEGCIHDGWLVLRDSKGELDQDFLFYLIGSRFMYERFSQLAAGSTVQNLNSALVSSIEIPVPPIDFQKRIAEKARLLEENVARLNEVNEIRVQHANDLRQSILEAAFAGAL
jgi:type I restriction enzyme S subunit